MTTSLTAQKRTANCSNKKLRKSGLVPCSLYGKNVKSAQIQVPHALLQKCLRSGSPKLNIQLDGQSFLASVEEAQREPATGKLVHVSFHAFNHDDMISMDVPLRLEGKAIGQTDGGVLRQQTQTICVYGPAKNLPEAVVVDISKLELGQTIHASDISTSSGWELKESADKVLVSCAYPKLQAVGSEPQAEVAQAPEDQAQSEEVTAQKQAA